MATAPNRSPREEVTFPPNQPVTVALKYAQPKMVGGINGERFLFSTCDGRVFFTDPEVAGQITQLGVNVRENFAITLRWDGHRESPRTWEVARVAGEQPNGTLVVPAIPPQAATAAPSSGAAGVSPKPPASAATASGNPLVAEANALVDAYAAVLDRALKTYEGRIKPDEVRSLLISSYIQRSKFAA